MRDLSEFGTSYSLALQKTIGEVRRATTKHDRIHDDGHPPSDWTTMLNERAQLLHSMAHTIPFDPDLYEHELLGLTAIAVSALAANERAKGKKQ